MELRPEVSRRQGGKQLHRLMNHITREAIASKNWLTTPRSARECIGRTRLEVPQLRPQTMAKATPADITYTDSLDGSQGYTRVAPKHSQGRLNAGRSV